MAEENNSGSARCRRFAAGIVLFLIAAYTIAVMWGLRPEHRIDPTTLGVIGIGIVVATILLRPDIFERVTHLEIAGWKLEIQEKQKKQGEQLQDIQLVLPILVPKEERKHLVNLLEGNTKKYVGNHEVRTELRRLRSVKLIEMVGDKNVGGIENGKEVDLADFVRLTDYGRRLVTRIKEIETAMKADETQKAYS